MDLEHLFSTDGYQYREVGSRVVQTKSLNEDKWLFWTKNHVCYKTDQYHKKKDRRSGSLRMDRKGTR